VGETESSTKQTSQQLAKVSMQVLVTTQVCLSDAMSDASSKNFDDTQPRVANFSKSVWRLASHVSKLQKNANALVLQLRLEGMAHSEQKASGDRMTLAPRRLKVQSIRARLEGGEKSTHELEEWSNAIESTWR
jgi:hypothetical protein